jgi:N-acetylmuramic acid 6-phosphate etherase
MVWVLGVAGGGTRTVAIVANEKGRVLGRGESGPATQHTIGLAVATNAIRTAALAAIEDAGLVVPALSAAYFGLAGVDRPVDRQIMAAAIASLGLTCKVQLDHESCAALAGATDGKPGVVIMADTGSVAFGEDAKGQRARAGGYGPLLGDEGSGYDIARKALAAALRAEDGRGPATLLVDRLRQRFMLDRMTDLINLVYGDPAPLGRAEIASLTALVIDAAQEGDSIARELLRVAGRELGLAGAAVLQRLDWSGMASIPVTGTGSVFSAGNLLALPMQQVIRSQWPQVHFMAPRHTAAYGAVLLALRSLGITLEESPGDRG